MKIKLLSVFVVGCGLWLGLSSGSAWARVDDPEWITRQGISALEGILGDFNGRRDTTPALKEIWSLVSLATPVGVEYLGELIEDGDVPCILRFATIAAMVDSDDPEWRKPLESAAKRVDLYSGWDTCGGVFLQNLE